MTKWLHHFTAGFLIVCLINVSLLSSADSESLAVESNNESEPNHDSSAKTSLETLNRVIGEWRGTAQPRRGSTQGAWRQTGEFVWDFSQPAPAIRYVVTDGQLVREARLTWNPEQQQFDCQLQTPGAETEVYSGNWHENHLILTTENTDGIRKRLTLTPLNEKRTLVLHEQTSPGGQTFRRIAEVGYTREGTHLAGAGGGQRECIVTGGTGTSTVTYKGETYYVCCSGCRQAFEDDPEGILAEFRERMKKRQAALDEK